VVLIGQQGATTLSAQEVARRVGTTAYELLSQLPTRVPRVYDGAASPDL
jgi:alanine racemase